jgi:ketosteroid isomerase-like protein
MLSKLIGALLIIAALSSGIIVSDNCLAQLEQKTAPQSTLQSGNQAIIQTDLEFAKMASDSGIAQAFAFYAADSATILRRNSLPIIGREAIRALYSDSTGATLRWAPFYADVAASNDLGYTLGKSQFVYKDSTGAEKISYGMYVTIWKKQPDGVWKYVLDSGVTIPAPTSDTTKH